MSTPPSDPAAAALSPAEVIAGRYRIVSVLTPPGAGTLGTTYAVVDLAGGSARLSSHSGGPELTLRVLADPGSSGAACSLSYEDQERFVQQAARLIAVRHPSVAKTYELGLMTELGAFCAREPVESEGQTLRDVLAMRGGALPEEEAILLCAQIGEALEAAHQQGACHLGLSPSCIFVYPDGSGVRIKIADFGLLPPAWAARVGEAGYLAPEQVDGPLGGYLCDRRTDQFALAVILYEMLAGQPAFIAATNEDRRIILGRVRNEDPLPLAQSRGVEQALARALSRSRAVRFSSIRDFVRALGADVSGWPTGAAMPATGGLPGGGRSPRIFVPMAAGAIFALLCLAVVLWLWPWLRKVPPSPPPAVAELALPPIPVPDASTLPPDFSANVPGPADAGVPDGSSTDGGNRNDLTTELADSGTSNNRPDLRRVVVSPTVANKVANPATNNPANPTANPKDGKTPPPGVLPPLQFGGGYNELTAEQRTQLNSCVKMISPQPPFEVWMQNINGILYVDTDRSSDQFSGSQDFRDCLKLSIKGKIIPKVLTITRMAKKVTL